MQPFRLRNEDEEYIEHPRNRREFLSTFMCSFPANANTVLLPKLDPIDLTNRKSNLNNGVKKLPKISSISANKRVEIWQFQQNSPLLVVRKTRSVRGAKKKLKKILKVEEQQELSLYFKAEEISSKSRFVDVLKDVQYPINIHVVISNIDRNPDPAYVTTETEDIIDPFQEEGTPLVLMSCGHATATENLFDCCLSQMREGKYQITCPCRSENCGKEWDFCEIQTKACLSVDEMNLFEYNLSFNWFEDTETIYMCPKCGDLIDNYYNINKLYFVCKRCFCSKFCCRCHLPWCIEKNCCQNESCRKSINNTQALLENCEKIKIDFLKSPECPSYRACPNCNFLIEHDGKTCKQMICKRCEVMFCFICLRVKTEEGSFWSNHRYYTPCDVAPVQQIKPDSATELLLSVFPFNR